MVDILFYILIECNLDVHDSFGEVEPVITDENFHILKLEDGEGHIVLSQEHSLILYCEKGFADGEKKVLVKGKNGKESTKTMPIPMMSAKQKEPVKEIKANCKNGHYFVMGDGSEKSLEELKCAEHNRGNIKYTTTKCGENIGVIVEIGFHINDEWVKIFEVCHNRELAWTAWAHYKLDPTNKAYQKVGRDGIRFSGDGQEKFDNLHTKNADLLYVKNVQIETFTKLLGNKKKAEEIVDLEGDKYLARGHLAAKVDFIFIFAQLATFFLVNAQPQFQCVNAGNWLYIEIHTRTGVHAIGHEAIIYSGTSGILSYDRKQLFLSVDQKNVKKIPVPKIYYKMIIFPHLNEGIVAITINNPFIKELKAEYMYCDDVMDETNFFNWGDTDRKDFERGYTYACTISSFYNNPQMRKELPKSIPGLSTPIKDLKLLSLKVLTTNHRHPLQPPQHHNKDEHKQKQPAHQEHPQKPPQNSYAHALRSKL